MNSVQKPFQDKVKLEVPIIARKESDDSWRAAVELPKALMAMEWQFQQVALGSVDETISELNRLHAASTSSLSSPELSWVRLDCVIWMEADQRGQVHARANFNWPDVWLDCDANLREQILAAVSTMLDQVRDNLSIR
ncbi:MAG: hypothetical protein AAGG55_03780 [Pseudomonadota bacterium]